MSRVLHAVGKALRETGLALDRAGATLQGSFAFREERESSGATLPCFSCCQISH